MVLLATSCSNNPAAESQGHLLQATLWYQHSAEMEALYIQAYNWGMKVIDQEVSPGGSRPMAVVLDIDETVLDNSPQTGRQLTLNEAFSNEMWDQWCELESAEALPGALEFTRYAGEKGVEVFYISNRGDHLLDVTLANLQKQGFPNADASHVLLKTETSVKDERRSKVKESHDIILLIGDNLGDFSGVFDERTEGSASTEVHKLRELFGCEFIMLPNPMYGSWEKPYREDRQGAIVSF